MKIRVDFVTNSSSASFIVATNLNSEDLLGRIFNLDMKLDDKRVLKEMLSNEKKLQDPYRIESEVLQVLNTIIPLDENDSDYIEMSWMDESTGNIRYKHIFVYKVNQFTTEWRVLFDLLKKFTSDKEIFVWHYYWGG